MSVITIEYKHTAKSRKKKILIIIEIYFTPMVEKVLRKYRLNARLIIIVGNYKTW